MENQIYDGMWLRVKKGHGYGNGVLDDGWRVRVGVVVYSGADYRGLKTEGVVLVPGEGDMPINCRYPFVWSFDRFEVLA